MAVSGLPPYDDTNIFARILRGEIPCKKAYEDEWALAFHDISPQAPVHVLVIPKGKYVSFADFSASASADEIAGFMRAVGKVAKDLGLEAQGYRLLANMGEHSGQEVPHFHVHLFAGRPLGTDAEAGNRPSPGVAVGWVERSETHRTGVFPDHPNMLWRRTSHDHSVTRSDATPSGA